MVATIAAILGGCVSPVDIEPAEFDDYLVVEGFITDDYGPHQIEITRVARFAGVRDGGAITIAEVNARLIDQNGLSIALARNRVMRKEVFNANPMGCTPAVTFVEVETHYFTPEDFKGEIGNTYTLEITTPEGERYLSEPQTIRPTPEINSLSLEFKELPSLDPLVVPSGVEVRATWQDPVEESNYYTWRINGIYAINTTERGIPGLSGTQCCLFDPSDGGATNCWIVEQDVDGNELAFSDVDVNGQLVTRAVGFIQDDGLRFASDFTPTDKQYYIEVEQFQISQEAFDFYERIKTLQEIDGEIFDPPPLSIRGNIYNVNNEDETVIGYFGAYAVQRKDIFIPRDLLNFVQPFTNPCGDCRVRAGAQTQVPEPYR